MEEFNTNMATEDQKQTPQTLDNSSQSRCRNEIVCSPCIAFRDALTFLWKRTRQHMKLVFGSIFLILYLVYITLALGVFDRSDGEQSASLIAISVVVICVCLWKLCGEHSGFKRNFGKCVACCATPMERCYRRSSTVINACVIMAVFVFILVFLIVDVAIKRPSSLMSAAGIVVFVTFMFLTSHQPRQVVWRPVFWGLVLQFVFALLVLRSSGGRAAFSWLADHMKSYMSYTDAGAKFAFGQTFFEHFFVFRVLPTIIFFSATISILYYVGAMQVVIRALAKVMGVTMATGGLETFHAAVNIFCGWAESLMVIRPFIDTMTMSELHAVMTNGFSTVAGSALAAYMLYGVSANHLISASFMSAPAALAMSKLFFPSDRRRREKTDLSHIPSQGSGLIDAASLGAIAALGVIAHILATLIAFISLLAFINDMLQWFGQRVTLGPPDHPPLTFQFICSYLLWPVAFLLGVQVQDCRVVARLLGVKIFINEFIAYADLGNVQRNREALENHVINNGTWRLLDSEGTIELTGTNTTLVGGVIAPRSEMLATYALCGFSDLVALGMMMAALCTLAPSRRRDILQVAPRALISGVMACLLTAAMAGLVVED